MYLRASLVVLAVLNVGVALWWTLRPVDAAAPPPPQAPATGVATLQLVEGGAPASASPPAPAPAAEASARVDAPPPATAGTRRCLRLGAFASEAQADAAAARVKPRAERVAVHAEAPAAASYRVMLPVAGDRQAATALTKRIAAAGFSDYYVITQGEDNSVALGQYRSREGAERRRAELVAAGFPAQLSESGGAGGASRWWLDVRGAADVDAGTLQRLAAADGARSLECAALR